MASSFVTEETGLEGSNMHVFCYLRLSKQIIHRNAVLATGKVGNVKKIPRLRSGERIFVLVPKSV